MPERMGPGAARRPAGQPEGQTLIGGAPPGPTPEGPETLMGAGLEEAEQTFLEKAQDKLQITENGLPVYHSEILNRTITPENVTELDDSEQRALYGELAEQDVSQVEPEAWATMREELFELFQVRGQMGAPGGAPGRGRPGRDQAVGMREAGMM